MKLYAFLANHLGCSSYFVMAENEESAKKYIDEYIGDDRPYGWGPDYYTITVSGVGEVLEHGNT